MASGWNSTALWSQISCPLHLLIQDHWSRRQFNLLSRVWLVMIYWEPFVLQPKPAQQSFWWIIYFSCGIFKLYLKEITGYELYQTERSSALWWSAGTGGTCFCLPTVNLVGGVTNSGDTHEKTGWQVCAVAKGTGPNILLLEEKQSVDRCNLGLWGWSCTPCPTQTSCWLAGGALRKFSHLCTISRDYSLPKTTVKFLVYCAKSFKVKCFIYSRVGCRHQVCKTWCVI